MKKRFYFLLLPFFFIACHKQAVNKVYPAYNVLILGNSITYSPANPPVGWNCNCGMAASAPANDYVHLITAHFKALNSGSIITAKNIAQFETSFDTYNYQDSLKVYKDANPQIIIMRIGENVTRTSDSVLFEQKYIALINYFKAGNPNVKILAAGAVWPQRDLANKVMSKYSNYISLISMQSDLSNFAIGLFADPGIQQHPDDKGMLSISNQIWAALQPML